MIIKPTNQYRILSNWRLVVVCIPVVRNGSHERNNKKKSIKPIKIKQTNDVHATTTTTTSNKDNIKFTTKFAHDLRLLLMVKFCYSYFSCAKRTGVFNSHCKLSVLISYVHYNYVMLLGIYMKCTANQKKKISKQTNEEDDGKNNKQLYSLQTHEFRILLSAPQRGQNSF